MPFGFLCTWASKDDIALDFQARVELLDNSGLDLILSKDTTGIECLERIGEKLGLSETTYFGLQYLNKKGSEWWLELDKPVTKQLQHRGKTCNNATLKFRVKFFVSSIYSLQEEITRYLYYLQLKINVLEGRLQCDEEVAVVLASYMAQAEFGDFDEERHANYVEDYVLLPCILIPVHTQDELNQQIMDLHKGHSGMSSLDAELEFIKLTQQIEGYGDEYYPAKDDAGFVILIGATFLGIVIRHPNGLPPVYFKWPDIIRITYSKKYFCIESTKTLNTIQFAMEDAKTAKYVWKMFVGHHRYRRLNVTKTPLEFEKTRTPKVMNTKRRVTLKRINPLEDSGDENASYSRNVDAKDGTSTPGGIINPMFDDDVSDDVDGEIAINSSGEDITQSNGVTASSFQTKPLIHRTYSNSKVNAQRPASCISEQHPIPNTNSVLDRPVSVDLSAIKINGTHLNSNFLNSGSSVAKNGPGTHGAAGSSLSVDSGHPPGSMEFSNGGISLDSLEEMDDRNDMVERTPVFLDSANAFAGTDENGTAVFPRPARPQSLNLEHVEGAADDASVVTGRTSGYSTSTDSDYSEDPWKRDDEIQEPPLPREDQLKELEKILSEGQVFTEFQKTSRKNENLAVTTGQLLVNVNKNRYSDVLPYEDTRVRLNPRNNVASNDYINANIVKMKVGRTDYSYIAAQGPTDKTTSDFWQMIWEQDVRVVVMATEERVASSTNCQRYWPDVVGQGIDYGHIRVVTEDVRDLSPYKTRRLKLRHLPSKQDRTLYHMQFTDWPDHKVPDDPTNFLEFLDQVESLRQLTNSNISHGQERPPVVVHCTAGVGRTGVIILTDLMIACIQNNQRINIHRTLIHLRRQRMLLVANFGQYRFIYTTVVHYIKNSRLI